MANLPKTEDCNCSAIRQAARQVTQLYDTELAQAGLRTSQFSILSRLRRKGPMTINVLAGELVMDRTTLSRNLMPLERDGLVAIAPSSADRRSKELQLTKAGAQRLVVADERWKDAQRKFEDAFGRRQSADLRGQLRAVVATIGASLGGDSDDE